MKNITLLLAVFILFMGCKKVEPTPDGPSDIRIRNITADTGFENVFVDIGDGEDEGEHNYGSVGAGEETVYFRFEIAYPDALITLSIGGLEYTTGVPDNTYAVPLQQGKFTYNVWISDPVNRILDIEVIADAPLDDM